MSCKDKNRRFLISSRKESSTFFLLQRNRQLACDYFSGTSHIWYAVIFLAQSLLTWSELVVGQWHIVYIGKRVRNFSIDFIIRGRRAAGSSLPRYSPPRLRGQCPLGIHDPGRSPVLSCVFTFLVLGQILTKQASIYGRFHSGDDALCLNIIDESEVQESRVESSEWNLEQEIRADFSGRLTWLSSAQNILGKSKMQ